MMDVNRLKEVRKEQQARIKAAGKQMTLWTLASHLHEPWSGPRGTGITSSDDTVLVIFPNGEHSTVVSVLYQIKSTRLLFS